MSIHNGGGVGIGYSQHAGMVVVADGTEEDAACASCERRADHATRALGVDPPRRSPGTKRPMRVRAASTACQAMTDESGYIR